LEDLDSYQANVRRQAQGRVWKHVAATRREDGSLRLFLDSSEVKHDIEMHATEIPRILRLPARCKSLKDAYLVKASCGMLWEPHESIREHISGFDPVTSPPMEENGVPEMVWTSYRMWKDFGFESEHSPFLTRPSEKGTWRMDGVDETPFTARRATSGAKPRGQVLHQQLNAGPGSGESQQYDQHIVNHWWELKKPYTFARPSSSQQSYERELELYMYFDCPDGVGMIDHRFMCEHPNGSVAGKIDGILLDIYYR
ncbi:MAG: hypothetical protein Q9180_006077, partial [Flavoplaca navasiana]